MIRSLAWMSLLAVLPLAGCSGGGEKTYEICDNGADDDGNGKTDCDDAACSGKPECDMTVDYGTCAKCGQACTTQASCFNVGVLDDRPLPQCLAGHCTAKETFVQVRVALNTRTNWGGVTTDPGSGVTYFIKKTAVDGSPVTCETIKAIASDRLNPLAISTNPSLQLLGVDTTPITNPQLDTGINFTLVASQTASDYLIWVEFWFGKLSSDTKFPTAKRQGYGCFETGLAPIVESDNCPSTRTDAGTCRSFSLTMPAPE